MRHVAFTGSRRQPTAAQVGWLHDQLIGFDVLHHGDCVGGDYEAHWAAKQLGLWVVVHPPTDSKYRAYLPGDAIRAPLPYLTRNRKIVRAGELLLALPSGPEQVRSGTWSTIRYAEKQRLPIRWLLPVTK